ncbi:diguanylate cyclase domain-containing protein [Labrys sp. ZIDIC5]|uniref:diguanylate cyclase domain-containing protein n=1 Tax=Labrys sedimenti TaxID=3106036 RepID=UPI002ACA5F11|nr:diguanylate cyclase [Labrys sp. ZIDIC5]MDZ5451042.1 diguanylate cyclase [Labrys sp. ZIDIC5]
MSQQADVKSYGAASLDTIHQSIMVLLVDDQLMVGEAIRRALIDETEIELHYCSNPLEALAVAKRVKPTVILQDLVMPNVNGLTLVRQYRSDPATKAIPVIVLSTEEEATVKSEAFRIGANDYLVKLPDRIELIARIRYHSAAYLTQIQRDEAYRALRRSQQELMETNLELQRLTNVDGLTGLSNRRYFDQYLDTEWRQAMRAREPISLLIIDVDHFKQYNDTYGHLAGDEVLKTVATAVRSTFQRPKDLAVRMGGEEFAVVLPQTLAGDLAFLAEKVVQAIEALGLPHAASPIAEKVTISVGGATHIPAGNDQPERLIEAADKAMYEAKRSGRNRAATANGL